MFNFNDVGIPETSGVSLHETVTSIQILKFDVMVEASSDDNSKAVIDRVKKFFTGLGKRMLTFFKSLVARFKQGLYVLKRRAIGGSKNIFTRGESMKVTLPKYIFKPRGNLSSILNQMDKLMVQTVQKYSNIKSAEDIIIDTGQELTVDNLIMSILSNGLKETFVTKPSDSELFTVIYGSDTEMYISDKDLKTIERYRKEVEDSGNEFEKLSHKIDKTLEQAEKKVTDIIYSNVSELHANVGQYAIRVIAHATTITTSVMHICNSFVNILGEVYMRILSAENTIR